MNSPPPDRKPLPRRTVLDLCPTCHKPLRLAGEHGESLTCGAHVWEHNRTCQVPGCRKLASTFHRDKAQARYQALCVDHPLCPYWLAAPAEPLPVAPQLGITAKAEDVIYLFMRDESGEEVARGYAKELLRRLQEAGCLPKE